MEKCDLGKIIHQVLSRGGVRLMSMDMVQGKLHDVDNYGHNNELL